MSPFWLMITILIVAFGGSIYGRTRAVGAVDGASGKLNSRPGYYASYVAIWVAVPAMLFISIAFIIQPLINNNFAGNILQTSYSHACAVETGNGKHQVVGSVCEDLELFENDDSRKALMLGVINSVATGLPLLTEGELTGVRNGTKNIRPILARYGFALGSDISQPVIETAQYMTDLRETGDLIILIIAIVIVTLSLAWSLSRIHPDMRARNNVERYIRLGLLLASTIAVLTTVGIVLSMLFEAIRFFGLVDAFDFFFGTVWDPRFQSVGRQVDSDGGQFGLLPLLWGTFYISLIALVVAVPIGLMSAIYMAEYANRPVRAIAKPLLEVLAGIPTIVYGFFALVTVGPFFRDAGALIGLDILANSVLTAGFVMGIMIIPFISSLSDDIIMAVPQSLREGSLALGATHSETIRRVVLPAALPGIVGSVLLAASRAIGETMIVVIAAGIAANLTANPFEAVTTVTVKIVSQLTGDLEFNSPQTLVAFALGITLFTITLCLNVFALHIVRKYREQYD
ncbi:MAG: phosphate ABC transporter permease subunit PstC [Cohaesibacteraceae bacterium]|nr:phosphate ABC transporter permease subunit PstC [Cohaesibacteraceae bacterium]